MPFLAGSAVQQPAESSIRCRRAVSWPLAVLIVFCALHTSVAETRTKLTREYDLKAAFLFNFAQFVEWPPDAFHDEKAPFVIGVLGEDPFGKSLDEIVANETVQNRKVVVQRYQSVDEIAICHILFISQSETPRLERIVESLDAKSILTVGETDGFSARSGMIRFFVMQNKLRLRINLEAARAARLTISSKLLRQAEIVEAKKGQR